MSNRIVPLPAEKSSRTVENISLAGRGSGRGLWNTGAERISKAGCGESSIAIARDGQQSASEARAFRGDQSRLQEERDKVVVENPLERRRVKEIGLCHVLQGGESTGSKASSSSTEVIVTRNSLTYAVKPRAALQECHSCTMWCQPSSQMWLHGRLQPHRPGPAGKKRLNQESALPNCHPPHGTRAGINEQEDQRPVNPRHVPNVPNECAKPRFSFSLSEGTSKATQLGPARRPFKGVQAGTSQGRITPAHGNAKLPERPRYEGVLREARPPACNA
jgi:hypothetical protein